MGSWSGLELLCKTGILASLTLNAGMIGNPADRKFCVDLRSNSATLV